VVAGDAGWRDRAARFSERVRDVSELLAMEPLRGPLHPVQQTVTYHDPCHVVHGQKIRKEPRILLSQIPGLQLVDLPESDWCCGSAGTYNLTQPEMAKRLQDRKVAHIREAGARVVVTSTPGCIIQIAQGLRAQGVPVEVRHIVEVLDEAYKNPSPPPRGSEQHSAVPSPPPRGRGQ